MRATSQDPDTARLMGINVDRIIVVAFARRRRARRRRRRRAGPAGTATSTSGWASSPASRRSPPPSSAASATSAARCVGGLVLGVVEAMAIQFIPGSSAARPWKDVWAFGLLILVLVFRPQGLLGAQVVDRA